ncbi:MAG: hypothetical protein QOJ40_2516 [Verrucomicrobiota bacterium]
MKFVRAKFRGSIQDCKASGCLGRQLSLIFLLFSLSLRAGTNDRELWVLKPIVQPELPPHITGSSNPLDAFIAAEHRQKGLKPAGPVDKRALLRRVYFDLIGLPPTPAEQDAFMQDTSEKAYEKVVDRLLASEQHGVRYARHRLDILRYADTDEQMAAEPGIYLWRDWMIKTLNEDLPYDQFVRAQLTGYRGTVRTQMAATGYRSRKEPRPDDLFALGLLARGGLHGGGAAGHELAIAAVETISTAFMGLTVGCAKCHDHFYDPIKKRDFYAMKALFDPLVLKKVTLASAADLFASGKAFEEMEKERAEIEGPMNELIAPYQKKLYDERVLMLPPEVQGIIRKPEKERTAAEQKIADDYFPVVRIDPEKIEEVMPRDECEKYKKFQEQVKELDEEGGGKRRHGPGVPVFWTVAMDQAKELEKSFLLTSGDPTRPENDHEVKPGWPFAPEKVDFREGRIEAFSDWLTAPENPLFARVAVNRLWCWHFGEGLQKTPSDFGNLGGNPSHPQLLDWLASEFIKSKFSMKQMHKLMVTSETYQMGSEAGPELAAANAAIDPGDTYLWHFRLQRLEAEPIWDSILSAAGELDLSIGGPSFDMGPAVEKKSDSKPQKSPPETSFNRRAAYIARGYSSSRDVMPSFLRAFDVDDGRAPCPMRTQTVTAPQSLFMMNSPEIEKASNRFAERLEQESGGDIKGAVDLAYRIALGRAPMTKERQQGSAFLENDPSRLKKFAWLLFNLDEFIYVR